jgi:hypothetical protein
MRNAPIITAVAALRLHRARLQLREQLKELMHEDVT